MKKHRNELENRRNDEDIKTMIHEKPKIKK